MSMLINPYRFAAADTLLTDLVAWWSLDEASGTRVDSHGSHDLTDNNTVGQTAGIVGNAASFAGGGANESLSVASHADFVIADTAFSIAGWASISASSDTAGRIFYKGDPGSSGGEWGLQKAVGSQSVLFRARVVGNASSTSTASVAITYDTPFFFIAYHDPDANIISLEINRGTPVTAAIAGGTHSATHAVGIGALSATTEMAGFADEFLVARRLWTTAEKDRLYNSGSGMAYPG